MIRSLTPQQATGNALAVAVHKICQAVDNFCKRQGTTGVVGFMVPNKLFIMFLFSY